MQSEPRSGHEAGRPETGDVPTPAAGGPGSSEPTDGGVDPASGVVVYAYGRRGVGTGRWHDIAVAVPEPVGETYRVLVVEMPAEVLRLWRVDAVPLGDARALLEARARRFVAAEEFGADSVRLNRLDDPGLEAVGRLDRALDVAHDWALTVEGHATLDPTWPSSRASAWRRATLSDSPADRAGSAALVAVHGLVHTAQRLAASPP